MFDKFASSSFFHLFSLIFTFDLLKFYNIFLFNFSSHLVHVFSIDFLFELFYIIKFIFNFILFYFLIFFLNLIIIICIAVYFILDHLKNWISTILSSLIFYFCFFYTGKFLKSIFLWFHPSTLNWTSWLSSGLQFNRLWI